jgi:hypothetical protein
MRKRGKKAQLTIFIILAILIVAVVLFIFLFWPKLKSSASLETDNPYIFIEQCIEEHIQDTTEIVTEHGGGYNVNEEMSFFHRGEYIRFLCHTNENFRPCYKQYAFLGPHIEQQILINIENEVDQCFESLINAYESEGFTARIQQSSNNPRIEVSIIPEFISINMHKDLFVSKGNDNLEFHNFNIKSQSELYNIIEVAENILDWESTVGDALSEAYMIDNPYIKVEKRLKEDEVKIYTITYRTTGEKFRFATRSLALPPGFL